MTQEAAVPAGLRATIKRWIKEEVANLARSGMMRNASVSGGSGIAINGGGNLTVNDGGEFRVNHPNGISSVFAGGLYNSTGTTYLGTGFLVQTPNGTDMAMFRQDVAFGSPRVELYDAGNRIIFSNDGISGMGLARPYVPGAFYRRRFADMSVSTTSATFETLWEAQIPKQHPKLEVGVRSSMDTVGATGEVRVLVNGTELVSPIAQSFALFAHSHGPASVAGDHMSVLTVEIQGRVVSGGGALRVEPRLLQGRQT